MEAVPEKIEPQKDNVEEEKPPIDRGYAWVVCFASFIMFLMVMGIPKSIGVFLVIFQEHYESSLIMASLSVSLTTAGVLGFVPLANATGAVFGYRPVACIGTLMMFVGMLSTAYAPTIYVVLFTNGILFGLGISAAFGPPTVILSMYFEKKRSLATGLAMCGSSVGMTFLPLFLQYMLQEYGYSGALLLVSGAILQILPAAMLLRPMTFSADCRKGRSKAQDKVPRVGLAKTIKVTCSRMWDRELLTDPLFLVFLLTMVLSQSTFFSAVIFLPNIFLHMFDSVQLSFLVPTILGISDIVGRLLLGLLSDARVIPLGYLLGLCQLIPAIVLLVAYFIPSVALMVTFVVVLGSLGGAFIPLLSVMLSYYFGLHKLSSGFGICTFFMGIVSTPLPIGMSELAESVGLHNSLLLANVMLFVTGCVAMFLEPIRKRRTKTGSISSANTIEVVSVDNHEPVERPTKCYELNPESCTYENIIEIEKF